MLFRAAEANGVLGSLVQRVFGWVLGVVGYLVYLWTRPGLPAGEAVPASEPEASDDEEPAVPIAARAAPVT